MDAARPAADPDQGLEFRNSFAPNPLCAPSRASLLTGQYSQNTGVFTVLDDNGFGAFDDRRRSPPA